MFRLTIIILLSIFEFSASAQGSWNIGYVEIDSINQKHIGLIGKIDFRNLTSNEEKKTFKGIRSYVMPRDTCKVRINGIFVTFIEVRKIYVDHGSYDDQYLVSLDYFKGMVLRIYNSEILDVNANAIRFKLDTQLINQEIPSIVTNKVMEVWVDRSKLDGLMIKI